MSAPGESPSPAPNPPNISDLLAIVRELVGEVNPHWKHLHFTPETRLERELGLDSLARMELCARIRARFAGGLDEDAAICAETPADLLRAVLATGPAAAPPANGNCADAGELLMGNFGATGDALAAPGKPGRTAGEWLYAVHAWIVFLVVGVLTWLLVVIAPGVGLRRWLARRGARLFFRLSFIPLRVSGREHLDAGATQVLVANHASYLDGFIVTAAVDIPVHFVVKGELAGNTATRLILQRLGVEFVDRFNAHHGPSDVRRLAKRSARGKSLVFFPEGTFARFPGLQPFRMGAFVTAARSGVPVVPVAIRGARDIVRGDDRFPRRGRIEVTIRPPVRPEGEGWEVALRLRDAARREISRYCGEPDLVEGGEAAAGNTAYNSG